MRNNQTRQVKALGEKSRLTLRSLSRSSASSGGACRRSPTSLSRSSSCCCISSAFGAPSSAISPAESGARAPGSSAPARDLQLLGFPLAVRVSRGGGKGAGGAGARPARRPRRRGGLARWSERWRMTRGIPQLYSLPTRAHPSLLPPFRATRRGSGARGLGWLAGVCLVVAPSGFWLSGLAGGWGACARVLEESAGDLWGRKSESGRAGAGRLVVWTAHFRAACQNCTRRRPQRTDASGGHGILFTWPASRPPAAAALLRLGWTPPGGRHLTPRDLGRRSPGPGGRWLPRLSLARRGRKGSSARWFSAVNALHVPRQADLVL